MAVPLTTGLGVVALLAIAGVRTPLPLFAFGLCAFAAAGILREWALGTWARHKKGEALALAFGRLLLANRARYGGYAVHLGILVLAVSVTASSFYGVKRNVSLAPGDMASLGGDRVEYLGVQSEERADSTLHRAVLRGYWGERPLGTLTPSQAFYPSWSIAHTRAAIRSTPAEDFYVVATEFSPDGRAIFSLSVNPLVPWMWASGPILLLGVLLCLWPGRQRAAASVRLLRAQTVSALSGGRR